MGARSQKYLNSAYAKSIDDTNSAAIQDICQDITVMSVQGNLMAQFSTVASTASYTPLDASGNPILAGRALLFSIYGQGADHLEQITQSGNNITISPTPDGSYPVVLFCR